MKLSEIKSLIRQAITEAQAYDKRHNTSDTPKEKLALGKLAGLLSDLNVEANEAMGFDDDDLDFSL